LNRALRYRLTPAGLPAGDPGVGLLPPHPGVGRWQSLLHLRFFRPPLMLCLAARGTRFFIRLRVSHRMTRRRHRPANCADDRSLWTPGTLPAWRLHHVSLFRELERCYPHASAVSTPFVSAAWP